MNNIPDTLDPDSLSKTKKNKNYDDLDEKNQNKRYKRYKKKSPKKVRVPLKNINWDEDDSIDDYEDRIND